MRNLKNSIIAVCLFGINCAGISKLKADEISDFNAAYRMYDNGLYDAARTEFSRLSSAAALPNIKEKALFYNAEALFFTGEYRSAAAVFRSFTEKYPASSLSANALLRTGDCEFQSGNLKQAETAYRKFIEKYSSSADISRAFYYLAESIFKAEKYAEAALWFSRITEAHKSSKYYEIGLYSAGVAFYLSRDYKKAEEYLSRHIKEFRNENTPEANFYMGSIMREKNNNEKASMFFISAAKSDDNEVRYASLLRLADIRTVQKRFDDAIYYYRQLEKMTKDTDEKARLSLKTAELFYRAGKLADAEREYGKILPGLKDEALQAEGLLGLSYVRLNKKDYSSARHSLSGLIIPERKMEKHYPEAFFLDAVCLYHTGEYEKSYSCLSALLPSVKAPALLQKINFYSALNASMLNKKEARELFSAAFSGPDKGMAVEALLEKANFLFRINDFSAAFEGYNEFTEKNMDSSGYFSAVRGLLSSLFSMKRYDEVIRRADILFKGFKDKDKAASIRMFIPKARLEKKEYPASFDGFRNILKSKPGSDIAAEAAFYMVFSRFKEERWKEAAETYYDIRSEVEKSAYAVRTAYLAASAYFKAGDYERSLIELSDILKRRPVTEAYYARAVYLAMDAAYNIKDIDKAIAIAGDYIGKAQDEKEKTAALIRQSWLYLAKNDEKTAFGILDGITGLYGNTPEYRKDITDIYFRLGEYNYSKKDYEAAAKNFTLSAGLEAKEETYYWLGMSYYLLKDYPSAFSGFQDIISKEASPYYTEAVFRSVYSLRQSGEPVPAFELAKKITDYRLEDNFIPEIILLKAELARELGFASELKAAQELLASKYPSSDALIKYLLAEAREKISENNTGEALRLLDRASSISGSAASFDARMLKAGTYELKNEYDLAAVEYLRIAYSGYADEEITSEALYRAGQMYEKTANIPEAVKIYRKVIDTGAAGWAKAAQSRLKEIEKK